MSGKNLLWSVPLALGSQGRLLGVKVYIECCQSLLLKSKLQDNLRDTLTSINNL